MSNLKQQIDSIVEELITAKQQALKPLKALRDTLSTSDSDKSVARDFIKEVCHNEDTIGRQETKDLVTSVALVHKIECEVGDYGNGEFLILEDTGWYGGTVGDWVSSSESC